MPPQLLASRPGGTNLEIRERLLVRLSGELGTKSTRTRRRFLQVLLENVRRALRAHGIEGRAIHTWSRVWVESPEPERARDVLVGLFGVRGVNLGVEVPFTSLEDLTASLAPRCQDAVRGRRFGVRTRRVAGTPLSPHDVDVALGAALLDGSAGVDLDHPEVEVQVLVGPDRAFCATTQVAGPGGLPLGTGGRALALLSGGFDSPVAAWHVMHRGVELTLVHFDLGAGSTTAALTVAQVLMRRWAPGAEVQVHVIDFAPLVAGLRQRAPGKVRQVLLKRAMYRAAGRLAREIDAEALVTGEALAQVSTQTLRSLAVCEAAAGQIPVLRPLIGFDKPDIIAIARRIGTHAASEQVQELCSIADGSKVVTWPQVDRAERAEAELEGLGGEEWLDRQLATRQIVDLGSWTAPAAEPDVEVPRLPPDAVVVDVREPWEGPPIGDLQLPYSAALELVSQLDPAQRYVLVCPAGQRSRALASALRIRGFQAYSLRGGLAAFGGDLAAAKVPAAPR
ncbi:MAG: THUMP domain-containing protein [Candidatus Dormiibacterota bacterium]